MLQIQWVILIYDGRLLPSIKLGNQIDECRDKHRRLSVVAKSLRFNWLNNSVWMSLFYQFTLSHQFNIVIMGFNVPFLSHAIDNFSLNISICLTTLNRVVVVPIVHSTIHTEEPVFSQRKQPITIIISITFAT